MARIKKSTIYGPALMVLLSAGLSYVAVLLMRRKKTERTCNPLEKEGSVPHTDFEAAAAIGRETGGEVFDD